MTNSNLINRRRFLRRSGSAAAVLMAPYFSGRNVLGANARLNVAGIGAGGKGERDLAGMVPENRYVKTEYRKGWEI